MSKISDDQKLIWNTTSFERDWGTGHATIWPSKCGRYRLCKMYSRYSTDQSAKYTATELVVNDKGVKAELAIELVREPDGKAKGNYIRYYDTIEEVIRAVERYHSRKFGNCFSNREKFLASLLTSHVQSERKTTETASSECQKRVEAKETDEQKVLKALGEKPKSADQLKDETGIESIRVLLLKMKKYVFRMGKLYQLRGKSNERSQQSDEKGTDGSPDRNGHEERRDVVG